MPVATIMQELEVNGPDRCERVSESEARARSRALANDHYENFSVLSRFVPPHLRDDFAAIYAFCRWSDDLGDEVGDRDRSLELLKWWRDELHACFAGDPRHPVYVALRPTITKCDLPVQPFDDLITAFEQDQRKVRYESWNDLIGYCRLSADPVGRLVLMVCGEPRTDEFFKPADAICTALQLTNHWQDVRRDILRRDRIYIPAELHSTQDFELRLRQSAVMQRGVDQKFLAEFRPVLKECVERTWKLFESGATLLDRLQPAHRPIIWLFVAGGTHVLHSVEMWNYETALHRPRLSAVRKGLLLTQAWLKYRRGSRS